MLVAGFFLAQPGGEAVAQTATEAQVREVLEQNRRLQQVVEAQQRQIDELRTRLDGLQGEAATTRAPTAGTS